MTDLPTVEIAEIPTTIASFVALRDRLSVTPQGGAATMVVALFVHTRDEVVGRACLAASVAPKGLQDGLEGFEGQQLRVRDMRLLASQLAKQPYLPASFFRGAAPANGYALPKPPLEIALSANRYSGHPEAGPYKVFVACSGASRPRPVTLVKEAGLWRASEWSSLIMGIMAPAS